MNKDKQDPNVIADRPLSAKHSLWISSTESGIEISFNLEHCLERRWKNSLEGGTCSKYEPPDYTQKKSTDVKC